MLPIIACTCTSEPVFSCRVLLSCLPPWLRTALLMLPTCRAVHNCRLLFNARGLTLVTMSPFMGEVRAAHTGQLSLWQLAGQRAGRVTPPLPPPKEDASGASASVETERRYTYSHVEYRRPCWSGRACVLGLPPSCRPTSSSRARLWPPPPLQRALRRSRSAPPGGRCAMRKSCKPRRRRLAPVAPSPCSTSLVAACGGSGRLGPCTTCSRTTT